MWEYVAYTIAGVVFLLHALGVIGDYITERKRPRRKYQKNWRTRR